MTVNGYVLRSAVVGALGGLLFGFDTAVVSGTTSALTQIFQLSPRELGFTVSIALLGTILGSMSAGILESKYGGRAMLRVMAMLYLLSALGCALADNWETLMAARFVGGIGIGGSSVLGPVYIAEISPARIRGRLVGMFQINIVIGVLLAYLSNYLISCMNLGRAEWRVEFGVAVVPSLLFFVMLFTIPRSARWLAAKGRTQEAEQVLTTMGADDPHAELEEIIRALREDASNSAESVFQWKYRLPIFLAVTLAIFNQMSGINAITYYLNDIFEAGGFSRVSGNLQAVAVGGMNLLATLLAMTLIDKWGRRRLLLLGSVGMVASLSGVAYVFSKHEYLNWLLPLLMVYIFFFAISQGAVIWVYLSELFPTRVRGQGQAVGTSTHWIMNAIISAAFPSIANLSPAYPFACFAIMMAVQFVVVGRWFPETKNVSLEDLQNQLVCQ